ncbi:DNA-processing protein DprA [Flagellimonas zhangzhouensis]|uniref:DNA processing protein n=1 Tax=Flagellimonas zhangzhouensis TaxID=1073328 RepID=A0A1H2UN98_9FLAO|nr:DNA-processing protein DprA [Allomuricauda zhangzhouensis]SDQ15453.1 DNA processing protein [Allomuricauda zhangzhouensis]SDW57562.1 DNA processing protein [Allomuricauda zhangzhouensis]
MTEPEIIAALRLQNIPNIGDVTAKKLISHCGSPTAVFEDKPQHLLKIDGIGRFTINGLFDAIYLEEAKKEYEFILKNDIAFSYFMDETYPSRLKHCVDGPIVLFQRGNMEFEGKKIISVVGTRNITSYGTAFCERFIEEIALLDPIIVSGLAYGVDIAIQKAAMDHGLQTIACLAHGLNQIYPKAHKKYASKLEQNGGFITEFWSTSNPDRENFLKRNRIVAGISEATIVIESAEKGGSLVTADLAHDYNREVFAVPGRATDKWSKGCNDLIKFQKAHLLTSAAELIYLLGWDIEPKKEVPTLQKQLFIELNDTEQSIYSYLQLNGKQLLDTVALECNLPIFKTSSTLLTMEMKGVIRPLPGKMFEAI